MDTLLAGAAAVSARPEIALARIPGWTSASVERLDGGLMSRSYRVATGDRRAVLKIDDVANLPPRNNRSVEARLQTAAHDVGLAARVLYADDTCLLTEYVDGAVWNASFLEVHSNLKNLGRALRSLHALPLCGRTFDALGAARIYARSVESESSRVADLLARIASIGAPEDVRLCHNDLVAGNIIETPALRFLDWEYACDNDPLFDLATIIGHHGLDETRIDTLMSAYVEGCWRHLEDRLRQQIELYGALLWLWQAALDASPGVS